MKQRQKKLLSFRVQSCHLIFFVLIVWRRRRKARVEAERDNVPLLKFINFVRLWKFHFHANPRDNPYEKAEPHNIESRLSSKYFCVQSTRSTDNMKSLAIRFLSVIFTWPPFCSPTSPHHPSRFSPHWMREKEYHLLYQSLLFLLLYILYYEKNSLLRR